jgi:LmbE family N-acetylglucosaminyl deacetylase
MRFIFSGLLLFCVLAAVAQWKQPSASEIQLRLKKLNVLGSVLYVAAHPDDENTNAIAYLANERLLTTGYLSLTRGDGGQNLIGPEIRDLLGLIRTQELLAARRIDRGTQFFTRANDFGFSKNPTETFRIWNKDTILSDVVRVIRQFKPDVIITRFPPDERAGHGHHTASAILAEEAIPLAANPNYQPAQVKEFGFWTVRNLYTNTGRWWNQTINETTPGVLNMNVGAYSPLLGKSYSEIAAESRSQHKSQGFGVPSRRGELLDFFEYRTGARAEKDQLEGIELSWQRVNGGARVQPLVDDAIRTFNPANPAASVPVLIKIRRAIMALESGLWRTRKLAEVDQLIQACAGLFVQATADQHWVAPGERVQVTMEWINRSAVSVQLRKIQAPVLGVDSTLQQVLANNKSVNLKLAKVISGNATYSDPYWLREPHRLGYFQVARQADIGKPENEPAVQFQCIVSVEGEELTIAAPLVYKWTDPVKGELTRPFEITPRVAVKIEKPNYIFTERKPQEMVVSLTSISNEVLQGSLQIEGSQGWVIEPANQSFELAKRGQEQTFRFQVTPAPNCTNCTLVAVATVKGQRFDRSLQTIAYDHIPTQLFLPRAEANAIFLDLKTTGKNIGYLAGAGDGVPSALRVMGYNVWEMKNEEVTPANLKTLDAVVLGVRSLNTNSRIGFLMSDLLEYVHQGGTLLVQYNNSSDLEMDANKIAPFPITLSRERVTDEDSEVRILQPDHPVLNQPNKITALDFTGWVQERGLYFPSKWDTNFQAILSMNDTGEPARDGSLLVARYGSGYYVYTGLSFFRQLPEGVPGAYRLLANLVSLGSSEKETAPRQEKPKKNASRK